MGKKWGNEGNAAKIEPKATEDGARPKRKKVDCLGHPDPARCGNASEAEFLGRASRLGFRTGKPWGNGEPYDVLVGIGQGFWRVQVKCASCYYKHAYRIKGSGKRGRYTKNEIDFLAAHIVDEDVWYIVPVEAFPDVTGLHFNPRRSQKAKYEKYREAWCLLACEPKARGWKDIPAVCRCKDIAVRCAVCPNQL